MDCSISVTKARLKKRKHVKSPVDVTSDTLKLFKGTFLPSNGKVVNKREKFFTRVRSIVMVIAFGI